MNHVTTKQIADRCGVSRITVDRALNGRAGLSEEKRRLILKTAQEMGYRPHCLAQALVRGESKSLGIVVFDLWNSFFAQLVDAFQRVAFENGYVTYVMLTNKDPALEKKCIEHLLSRQVDAIALDSATADADYPAYVKGLGIPVLSLLNRISSDIPLLGFDDRRAMYDMTSYVLSKGYERLLYVCPPLARAQESNMDSLLRRKAGFDEAVRDGGAQVEVCVLGDQGYLQEIDALDFRRGPKTAILCTSDVFAIAIQGRLQRRGLRTPFDYGLTGFDGVPMLHEFEPRISTLSLHIEELGTRSALMLLDCLQGREMPPTTTLPYDVLPGQTIL